MRVYLVDNGSLRPQSWANLSQIASALSQRVGIDVQPASVLHSTRIPLELIPGGCTLPTTWERATRAALAQGERSFLVLPLFFGPTGAITEYLPERKAILVEKWGEFALRFAPFLGDALQGETVGLADLLSDQVPTLPRKKNLKQAPVILVDHGSPKKAVTDLRDCLGHSLQAMLAQDSKRVSVASMERRDGPEYAFNEPLLETALRDPALPAEDVIISMLFLSPGRHAGPDGDIATICEEAEAERPGLKTHMTDLVGQHPGILDLLERRLKACL